MFVSLCGPLVIIRTAPPTLPPSGTATGWAHILTSSSTLSCDRVFLMRRAVSLAAPLAYQHSLMIFPITRRDCTQRGGGGRTHRHTVGGRGNGLVGMTQKNLLAEKIEGLRCPDEEAGPAPSCGRERASAERNSGVIRGKLVFSTEGRPPPGRIPYSDGGNRVMESKHPFQIDS